MHLLNPDCVSDDKNQNKIYPLGVTGYLEWTFSTTPVPGARAFNVKSPFKTFSWVLYPQL